ncbi:hypothetical protein M436DRAFT_39145 [Aureobasidium namibiae CBS 147.97]|uniref:BHLH domain-containing protein n=1 Tax=Aureobasidium namibiae CBS 147.97 TaxID=1043004 RepID=A0A074WU08_9PEZI|nr:uncharacterized protein M436DRAFT_39145 [Aureobasidium namibiae CBS 147.97]KEQ76675.1 hypothetical protein M436DRAFT_39145 [Aureobasidium namibiae CBS 147.97]
MQDIDFASFIDIGDIGDIGNLDVADFPSLDGPDAQGLASTGPLHDFGTESFGLPTALDVQTFAQNQQWPQQQVPQDIYRAPNIVPPTPNSYELQGNARHYMAQHMDSGAGPFYDQHHRLTKEDNMSFTPLVSPAVTPRHSAFQPIPEYTIPGAYFSPLTSPALHAQQQQQQNRSYAHSQYTNPTTADNSAAASPLDLNMDIDSLKDTTDVAPRRSRRKPPMPHSAGPTACGVRQSPIVKAQRRRSAHLSTIIPPREVNNILIEAQSQSRAQGSRTPSIEYMPPYHDDASAESISPEALPDLVMGPPPLPASIYNSPALQPQIHSAPASTTIHSHPGSSDPCPATPASLMSIRKSQQQNAVNRSVGPQPGSGQFQVQSQDQINMLEDLALPPSAAEPARPALSRIVTTTSGETTPRLAPAIKGTPRLAPSNSTAASPIIGATNSPALGPAGRKLDQKRSQPAKKRGSVSTTSVLVSPAIRPKISPSIKPLLPEGGTETQQALLLASKSNYTHLLEGTRLPGVSYPESLSMGLTSKRTSHKIAEQGRRNRINEAIKEMQTLLPKTKGKGRAEEIAEEEEEANSKDGKGNTAEGRSANSKAATVESAIDYIKLLQQERTLAFEMLQKKDEEMAALRKQLQAADITTSASDSANDSLVASSGEENDAEPEKMEGVMATP